MKIRRFVAKDMRSALEQIKHELGADAVIMSNKKVPEGVELMAAVDYAQQVADSEPAAKSDVAANVAQSRDIENDVVSLTSQRPTSPTPSVQPQPQTQAQPTNAPSELPADSLSALLQRQQQAQQAQTTASTGNQSTSATPNSDLEQQLKAFTDRLEQGIHSHTDANDMAQQATKVQIPTEQHTSELTPAQVNHYQQQEQSINTASQTTTHHFAEMEQMRQEMLSMRQLLEHQLSGLMWQDMAQKDPMKALLMNRLLELGLSDQVADHIASCIPGNLNEENAWQQAKTLLAQQLHTTNNDIIRRGGVVSLVGPTGVGKTTTVAKLAARFAQIHGADSVAMISTDSYRIAGFEQLSTYGRIIGCQVQLAKDGAALETLLQQFANKKLVLIDTAGMGQRDMRLAEHLATLITHSRVRIRNYLVLAANAQHRVMQENVERFKKVPIAGCIYTKLDESLSVGEIIATSIQNGLPIGYLTDGQRVPEDIKVANTEKLVTLADRLATKLNHQVAPRPMPASQVVAM